MMHSHLKPNKTLKCFSRSYSCNGAAMMVRRHRSSSVVAAAAGASRARRAALLRLCDQASPAALAAEPPQAAAKTRIAAAALATLLAVAVPGGSVSCGAAHAAVAPAADNATLVAQAAAAPALAPAPAAPSPSTAAPVTAAGAGDPVYDGARIVAAEVRAKLSSELRAFEQQTGFKVRVFTSSALGERAAASPRELWGPPDARSVWIRVDPSSPNILNLIYIGDEPLFKLRRPFFQELQTRYGNQFFVRDNGETAAVVGAVGALSQCLGAPEGCRVVPGLPEEQQAFTAAFAAAGGLVAGFVSRLPPQGIVSRRFVWLIIFSPLWASLFINFGIGPIVSRTSDPAPVLINVGVFFVAAALPYLDRLLASPPPPPSSSDG